MKKPYTMTVADFKALIVEPLKMAADTDEISFGGGLLSFYRVKWRGDHLIDLEFDQVFKVEVDPHET